MPMTENKKSVFWASFFEQRKTLERLIQESRADFSYFFFIGTSAFVTTLGLVADNIVVVTGGMLLAPLLFPILSLAMGVTTSNTASINRAGRNIAKSVGVVLAISFLSAFLFLGDTRPEEINFLQKMEPSLSFFLVAFAAGLAAAFAWAKQNLNAALPGVAVAVSLIPPLSGMGVGMASFNVTVFAYALSLFLINLLGITVASMLIFSLFGFSQLRDEEKRLIAKEEISNLQKEKEKLEETKEKLERVTEKISEVRENAT